VRKGIRKTGVLLILALVCHYAATVPSQAQSLHTVYLPVVTTTFSSFGGTWQGKLTQPGTTFDFQLALNQSNDGVTGTSTIRKEDGTYAILSLNGTASESRVTLEEKEFIEQTTEGGWYWCVKTMSLNFSIVEGVPSLEGAWSDPGCNSGNVYLQQPNSPVATVDGLWKGTLQQSSRTFDLEFNLKQTNAEVQGTSTIRTTGAYGVMRVAGVMVGRTLFLKELEILESSGAIFCLKEEIVTYQSVAAGKTLTGNWFGGCGAGTISLQKQ
jgi:hypothetical protein